MVDIVRATIGGLRGPMGADGVSDIPGPAGSVADYTGTLTRTGPSGIGFRQTAGDSIDGDGNNNRGDLLISLDRNTYTANQEGAGIPPINYINDVGTFGVNIRGDRSRDNADSGGAAIVFETKFFFNGEFCTEFQIVSAGLDGSVKRIFQGIAPENGTSRGKANLSTSVDRFVWYDFFGAERANWDLQNGVYDHVGATTYRFNGNGHAPFQQMNAAGNARIPLPWINSDDFQVTSAPTLYLRAAKTNATYGIHGSHIEQITALASGSYVERVFGNAVTGNLYGFSRVFPVSGELIADFRNQGAGKAVIDLIADAGASSAEYRVNGTKVVSGRGAAVANGATDAATNAATNAATDAAVAVAAPTKAEFDALVAKYNDLATKHNDLATKYNATSTKYNDLATKVNTLFDRLRPAGHGLIAT